MVIVDTSVWIDYLNNKDTLNTAWMDAQLQLQRLALTDLILCEILQGLRNEQEAVQVQRALEKFEIWPTGGRELSIAAAANYRALRSKGRTVRKTIDCLIATFCLSNRHLLLHNDRDFDAFEQFLDLQVIHP
jgi:predicted nucleic acid-binding protein